MSKKISQIVSSAAVLSLLLLAGAGCAKEEVPSFQGDGYSGTIENVRIEKAVDKPNNNRDYWNEEDTMGDSVENAMEDDQKNTDVSGEEVTESEVEAVEE